MSHYTATCTLTNNSESTLTFAFISKGTDSDPVSKDHTGLYHGEMESGPTPGTIEPGETTTWVAKSNGKTVEGSVNFYVDDDESDVITCFFHVGRGGKPSAKFEPSADGTGQPTTGDGEDQGQFSYSYTKQTGLSGQTALAGADQVLALSETFINNLLFQLFNPKPVSGSHQSSGPLEHLIASISESSGAYSAKIQDSASDLHDALSKNSALQGIDVLFGIPELTITDSTDITQAQNVTLTLPIAGGRYYTDAASDYQLSGTDFTLTVPLAISDVTSKIQHGNFTSEPFLQGLQKNTDFGEYTISAIYLDLENASVQSGTTYGENVPSDQQDNLWSSIQALLGENIVLGFLNLIVVSESARAPFLPTAAALSTTHSSQNSGDDLSALNVVMMSQGVILPSAEDSGKFSNSLFKLSPSTDTTPSVLFLTDYTIFQEAIIAPFVTAVSEPLADGFPGFTYSNNGFEGTTQTWKGNNAKKISSFDISLLGLGIAGIKVEFQTDGDNGDAPTTMSTTINVQPVSTSNSTYIDLSGSFHFTTPMTIKEEALGGGFRTIANNIYLSTDNATYNPNPAKYQDFPVGQPGTFDVKIQPTIESEDDSGTVTAGNLSFTWTSQAAELGMQHAANVKDPTIWGELLSSIVSALTGGLLTILEQLAKKHAFQNALAKNAIAQLDKQLKPLLQSTAQSAAGALTGMASENFQVPQSQSFDVKDLNMAALNGGQVVTASYQYTITTPADDRALVEA